MHQSQLLNLSLLTIERDAAKELNVESVIKIKMAGSSREMSSEMGDNHDNFDIFRLDSSVCIKTRICAEVT